MRYVVFVGVLFAAAIAHAQTVAVDDGKPWPEAQFEIFKLAPGKHEAFLRKLAQWDQVSAAGGQPPTQIFIHEDGGDWDVLLFKPFPKTPITPAQQSAMDAKADTMTGAAEASMEAKADAVREAGDAKADAQEDKADKMDKAPE